jgi:hypothetical protein
MAPTEAGVYAYTRVCNFCLVFDLFCTNIFLFMASP